MDREEIARKRAEIEQRFGPWTGSPIHLGENEYTRAEVWPDSRLRLILQVVADLAGRPIRELRVLDLGSLEGQFAIELALHGAEVVAVEGRENNWARARFAKEHLRLDRLECIHDDVRNLNRARYGEFDAVLCLGLLYHLDAPDLFSFIEAVGTVCRRTLVVDTLLSPSGPHIREWRGKEYYGLEVREHDDGASVEQRATAAWNSLDNTWSFHLTKPSLCNLLTRAGFTTIFDTLFPTWTIPDRQGRHLAFLPTRFSIAALKGEERNIMSSPVADAYRAQDVPETPEYVALPQGFLPGRS